MEAGKKIKHAGQVINFKAHRPSSKARGQWLRALEFITWPKGLIFFSSLRANKNILAMALACQKPILNI